MAYTFCFDFGSTFTKLCVFDLENGELVMTTKHPSTVAADANISLLACLEDVKRSVGEKGVRNAQVLTSSSIAGGLRMVVIGLTKRFSLLAGKNVALGAGARIIKTYENNLTQSDVVEIEKINPEIILLCGGIDNGNVERLVHNAALLKDAAISSYVVYAGNVKASSFVRQELMSGSIKCYITENIFPAYGKINSMPAGEIIRDLFMERISGAKGLAKTIPIIGKTLVPTPAAVLEGGRLLAKGTNEEKGFSDLMVFDVGGATTDVYSYTEESQRKVKHVGAPEPYAKRTVEGDLGVRSSCMSLIDSLNLSTVAAQIDLSAEELKTSCQMREKKSDYVAGSQQQKWIDLYLTQTAVEISARRHCGQVTNAYAKNTCKITEGKDLSDIHTILGTGGPIVHSEKPLEILSRALGRDNEKTLMLPKQAKFYLDKSYILYAVGLCAGVNPNSALHIAKENIIKIV